MARRWGGRKRMRPSELMLAAPDGGPRGHAVQMTRRGGLARHTLHGGPTEWECQRRPETEQGRGKETGWTARLWRDATFSRARAGPATGRRDGSTSGEQRGNAAHRARPCEVTAYSGRAGTNVTRTNLKACPNSVTTW
jgi:hypothetical protein